MSRPIHITFEIHCDLTIDEVWPDGDAPAEPTVEAVIAEIQKSHSMSAFLRDWNLLDEGELMVRVDSKRASLDSYMRIKSETSS